MPGDPRLRASDADRDRVASLLQEHHAEGRLTAEEFTERVDKALTAKTLGDLDALLADLPAIDLYRLPAAGISPDPPGARRPSRRGRVNRPGGGPLSPGGSAAWSVWAVVSALLFVMWLGTMVITHGVATIPWFLLIAVPWLILLTRRRH
jgi:uncharacterized protein DUF1707